MKPVLFGLGFVDIVRFGDEELAVIPMGAQSVYISFTFFLILKTVTSPTVHALEEAVCSFILHIIRFGDALRQDVSGICPFLVGLLWYTFNYDGLSKLLVSAILQFFL